MTTFLYARVSTDKQENGREAQTARLTEWASGRGYEDCRLFVEEDASSLYIPLQKRKEGKKLWDLLAPGDTVIMTKVDRGFRSMADAAVTHANWQQIGIRLRFADLDIDLSTPQGELFFNQLVAFAQYESRMHGQRKREVYAHKRRLNQPYSFTRPYGWRVTKDKRGKLSGWAPLPSEQRLGHKILDMRRSGMSWFAIASSVADAGHRKPVRREGEGYYHVADVRNLARAAASGYPTVPQASWQAPDYEQRLREDLANGIPISFAGSGRSGTCQPPAPDLSPDRQ
jgi:DNA invertase Pin-like site-specific DNA recombinase